MASEGGALRIRGTAELLNSSFFENESGEGGGSAISNVGVILGMVGLSFSTNAFQCPSTHYFGWKISEVSVYFFFSKILEQTAPGEMFH